MIFGNKDKFGIECVNMKTVYNEQMKWCYGNIYYLLDGCIIGDDKTEETINSIIVGLKRISFYKDKRNSDYLYSLESQTALNIVYDSLYKDDDRSIEQINNDSDYYIRFVSIPIGFDSFMDWKAILIEEGDISRYIWSYKDSEVKEIFLNYGEFDTILKECINWLNSLLLS